MFEKAVAVLKTKDPILREVINRVGTCTLELEQDAFKALTESIIYQQLSIKAAGTIAKRFTAIYPNYSFPDPKDVLSTPDGKLREVGISNQKARYLKDLSHKFLDGIVTPSKFPDMSDEEIIEHLTKVKGIGRWTAEMFLIFSLGRPNVLPVDDLGFQKAVQRHYGIENFRSESKLRMLAKKWEPYCSVATWYLWRSLDVVPVRE
ncbi:DNA-3-methyladenine glycosylase 2 family protein [candidate division KSB1 bacterium]|nr:DNA-3-methyladenine glycosylase 2 family protein [candidate division KSB1 bacterium]